MSEIPSWLMVNGQPTSIGNYEDPYYKDEDKPTKAYLDFERFEFDRRFPIILEQLMTGLPLSTIFNLDHRGYNRGRFLRWVNGSLDRKNAYNQARKIGAEIMIDETIGIADALESMEDVQRSALRIKTRQWYASKADPKKFGDTKQVDITTTDLTPDKFKDLNTSDIKRLLLEGEYTVGE